MSAVGEIEQFLYALAPKPLAQSWDNVGLLVGRPDREVKKVLVSLDITEAVAEEASRWGAELIVAHHPVIFGGVKSVTDRDPTGRTLRTWWSTVLPPSVCTPTWTRRRGASTTFWPIP